MPRSPHLSEWELGGYFALDYNTANERVDALFVHHPAGLGSAVTVTLNYPETRQADGSYGDGFTVTAQPGEDLTAAIPAGKLRARVTAWVDTDGETYPDVLVVYNSAKGQPSAFPQAWEKLSYSSGFAVLRSAAAQK